MKKLLYIYQNYWKTYSSATLSILRGFNEIEKLNVDSFEVKPLSYKYQFNRILNNIPLVSESYFKWQNNLLEKKALHNNYDYLFVMKGTDIKAQTLINIKTKNPRIKLICFNPDDPFNLASSNEEIIKAIPLYDHYCMWTRHLNEKLLMMGAKDVIYFPFGVDREVIFPVKSDYKYDVSFVGNCDEERQSMMNSLMDELKRKKLKIKVHVFGNNWSSKSENLIVHGPKLGNELLETISASRINLNLLRKQNKNSINMKTFEIPAAGGFMFHENSIEAQDFFRPNKEAVYFKSIEELADLCEFYLKKTDKREMIVKNSEVRILQGTFSYKYIINSSLEGVL